MKIDAIIIMGIQNSVDNSLHIHKKKTQSKIKNKQWKVFALLLFKWFESMKIQHAVSPTGQQEARFCFFASVIKWLIIQ